MIYLHKGRKSDFLEGYLVYIGYVCWCAQSVLTGFPAAAVM